MTLTGDAILGDVTILAASVSRVPATHIAPADTLKVQLGMNRADLVRFANLLTALIRRHNPAQQMPFEVVDKKGQTVGGVAADVCSRVVA